MRTMRALLFAVVIALLLAACGGSSKTKADRSTTTTSSVAGDETTTSLPAGSIAGFDDYNGDGQPERLCATQDFGAGLVLRLWCDTAMAAGYAPQPPDGVTLMKDSLFRLPGVPGGGDPAGFEGMSGSVLQSRDVDGNKVIIVTSNSDSLFETGSAQISSNGLDAVVRGLNQNYPPGRVQVRGHTDSTGSPATNQTLSEQRAANVKSYLESHGLKQTGITSVGLSSTRPLAEENNDEGRKFNRRVEIVVRTK
jgi:outer membrane protein OmpA-like peptidoglycan-associated protein